MRTGQLHLGLVDDLIRLRILLCVLAGFVPKFLAAFKLPLRFTGVESVLRPFLISGRARISALAIFVGVLGGIPAFGAIGIVVGPVVLSLVLALSEFAEESCLHPGGADPQHRA